VGAKELSPFDQISMDLFRINLKKDFLEDVFVHPTNDDISQGYYRFIDAFRGTFHGLEIYALSLINLRYQNETLINDHVVAVLRCIYGIKILE